MAKGADWSRKIGKPIKWKSSGNPVAFVPKNAREADAVFEDAFWQSLMDDYLEQVLLPEMARSWAEEKSDPMNYPQTIAATATGDALDRTVNDGGRGIEGGKSQAKKKTSLTSELARQDMKRGFDKLYSALTTKVTVGKAGAPGVGIGPMSQVMELKLSRFMPHAKGSTDASSDLNSLFYAIEYGTGMLAGWDEGRPGNPSFIRTEGETKDPRPRFRGSWWLGPQPGMGIHWKGQQGAHFLFDARTRDPSVRWRDFLQQTLPKFVKQRLGGGKD